MGVIIVPMDSSGSSSWPSGIGLLVLVAYLLGVLVSWVPITRAVIAEGDLEVDDKVDLCVGIGVALCVAFCWPLFIPGYWIYTRIRDDK